MNRTITVQYGVSIKEIELPDPFNSQLLCNSIVSSFSCKSKDILGLRVQDSESVIPIDEQLDGKALLDIGSASLVPFVIVFHSICFTCWIMDRSIDKSSKEGNLAAKGIIHSVLRVLWQLDGIIHRRRNLPGKLSLPEIVRVLFPVRDECLWIFNKVDAFGNPSCLSSSYFMGNGERV